MRIGIALLVLFFSISTWSCSAIALQDHPAAPATNESEAKKMAEKAFLEATGHKITTYSVLPLQHSTTQWHFVVSGTDEFARPGNQWFIELDKLSGKTTVQPGE